MYTFFRRRNRRPSARSLRVRVAAFCLIGLGLTVAFASPGFAESCGEKFAAFAGPKVKAAGRIAREGLLLPPRAVASLAVDTYLMAQRWGRDTFAPGQSPLVRLRRQFIMKRENPGETGFWDFLRDPLTSLTQPRPVRGLLGRLAGRNEPVKPFEWTLAEIPSLVAVGGATAYVVDAYVTQPTDELNKSALEKIREGGLPGYRVFEAWYRLGQFASHSDAHRAWQKHLRTLKQWKDGDLAMLPGTRDLLEAEVFGESDSVAARQAAEDFDRRLRMLLTEAARAHAGLPPSPAVEFDDFLQQFVRKALAANPIYGETAGYFDEDERALFALVLGPRIEIEGKSDLAWLARARNAGKLPLEENLRNALKAAWGAYREMRVLGEESPQTTVFGARIAAAAAKSVTDAEPARAAHARAERERAAAATKLAEAEAAETKARQPASANSEQQTRRIRFYADRTQVARTALRLAEIKLADASARRNAEDPTFAKISRARAIDSFCETKDCRKFASTFARPDLPFLDYSREYFAAGKTKKLASEMDYWQTLFHDVRYGEYAQRKIAGKESDAAILKEFSEELAVRGELNRAQDQVFWSAIKAGEKDWRTDNSAEIPKPGMKVFCDLLGYDKKKKTPPHRFFAGARVALDRLEGRIPRPQFQACRAFLARVLWDYYAMESNIADSVPENANMKTRDLARARILEHQIYGQSALRDALQGCVSGEVGVYSPEEEKTVDCESL